PDALITVEGPLTFNYRKLIADFSARQLLPTLHGAREDVAAGALMSYGANLADLSRRAAGYVDKSSGVPSRPTFRSSSRPSSRWSSTPRRPGCSASPCPDAARPRRRGDRVINPILPRHPQVFPDG